LNQLWVPEPVCPWARHLTPSCSRGMKPLTYIAIVSCFG